jgi:hypothetical protein
MTNMAGYGQTVCSADMDPIKQKNGQMDFMLMFYFISSYICCSNLGLYELL